MEIMIINQDNDRIFNLDSIKEMFVSNAGILYKSPHERYPEVMASYGYCVQANKAFDFMMSSLLKAQHNKENMFVFKLPLQEEMEEMFPLPEEPVVGGACL